MTTLDVAEASEDSLGATVCLLGMIIKRVQPSVLKLTFSTSAKSLLDLLGRHIESENSILVRSLIGCLGVLLRHQDAVVWSASSTLQIYDALLTFVVHPKSKIRKAAQHAICATLKGSTLLTEGEDPPLLHPVSSHTGKYCIKFIEENASDSSPLLHMLNMMKEIFSVLPQSEVKSLSETLLKIMTLNNVLMTSCAMQCFHGLFSSRPRSVSLSSDLNARLIAALYDYQPSLNDTQPLSAWLNVMTQAHLNLARLEPVLCSGHLPRFFSTATQMWLSDRLEIVQAVTPSLASLLSQCLEPALVQDPQTKSVAEKVVRTVETGLGFQFIQAWKYVIYLSTTLIEVVGKNEPQYLSSLLKSLAGLRASPRFPYEAEVDYAIGKAVRISGPRFLLKCVPLSITGQEESYEFTNSWLLPILRENISHTELCFFIEYFLPLAQKCHARVPKCQQEQDRVGFRVFDLLQRQMWALLPGFCKYPTDISTSFKMIARLLGQVISDRADIRMDVMAALRQLIIHSNEDENIRTEISRFAKNYLPLLFNLYTTKAASDEEESHRRSAYETIGYFLQIADPQLLHPLFDAAKSKLENVNAAMAASSSSAGGGGDDQVVSDENKFVWESVLDLLRVLVVRQDSNRIEEFVQLCLPWIMGGEAKAQKKAYRILEQILNSEVEVCANHVRHNVSRVVKLFTNSREAVKTTSRASRMRSLCRLATLLEPHKTAANGKFLKAAANEAVAGVREVGEKARSAAFALLVKVGQVYIGWNENSQEALKDYMALLMKKLEGGGDAQVTAAVTSITCVVQEFAASCTEELINGVLDKVCHLLVTCTRDVVLACLGFIRMFVVTVHSQRLPFYLKTLMHNLSAMSDEHQRAYRVRTRDIFIRLMRKCGAEFVMKLVPAQDTILVKRLNNLRKIEARKKKVRSERQDQDHDDYEDDDGALATRPKTMEHVLADSDDDDLDEQDSKEHSAKNKARKTWIQEGDIVDLLDPTAVQKVSATDPLAAATALETMKKKKSDTMFKMSSDGRMIIEDDGSSSDDSTESDVGIRQAMDSLAVGKKRKAVPAEDNESVVSEPAFKYQAGGSGIHRPIDSDSKPVRKKLTSKMKSKMDKNTNSKPVDYGAEYRSSKAKGDVKRKGKPDPFAYVPLTKSVLNKRKKAKLSGQFNGLVRAVRKGAGAAKPRPKSKS